MYRNEQIYHGEKKVKYVFNKAHKKTDRLIILFSGFHPEGEPPRYNYGGTIKEFHCNKLFILDDFGARGSYYLCENKDFTIERSVIGLINKIIKENDINSVMTAGSSKGGYAALYYGIKYGFDYIVAASPQYYIGNYLVKETRTNKVAKFMAGGDSDKDVAFLNNILKEVIVESKNSPEIFIHLGEGEKHYKRHVSPMIKELELSKKSYVLDLGKYTKHSEVGLYFPPLFKDRIREYFGYSKLEITVKKLENGKIYRFEALTDKENEIAWYLSYNNRRVDKTKYIKDMHYDLNPKEKGEYKVTVFSRNKEGLIVTTTSPVIKI